MPRSNLTPRAVVVAAARLADADGLDAVTVSAVARSLSVQPASLYEHVAGLAGLLQGVQILGFDELAARVADAVAGLSEHAALRALADAQRDYARERPGVWEALQRPASAATAASPEAARVATLTLAVLRGYAIPETDRIHAARVVGATINGFLSLSRGRAFAHRPDDEDISWSAAVDTLDRALRSWPTSSPKGSPS